MKDDNALMGCIGLLAYTLVVIVGGSIAGGWALSIMWGWFVVPLFSVPALGIAQAVGLMCVVGMVFPKSTANSDGKKKDSITVIVESFVLAFVAPFISVGIGWIVYQFIK